MKLFIKLLIRAKNLSQLHLSILVTFHYLGTYFFVGTRPYICVKGAISGLFFFIFVFPTDNSKYMFCVKFCQWLDLNCGPSVSEAVALPTEPQPSIFTYRIVPSYLYLLVFLFNLHVSLFISPSLRPSVSLSPCTFFC